MNEAATSSRHDWQVSLDTEAYFFTQQQWVCTPAPTTAPTVIPTTHPLAHTKAKPSSKLSIVWTDEMNITLCREVDLINPFQYKERTKERGQAWDTIAENLQKLKYSVTKRSVRDRYKLLKDQVLKKNREDAKASGISTDEASSETELTHIIEELVELEKETREQQTELQEKEEKKEQDGAEMRKRALETFSETSKRNKCEKDGPSKKRRNTGSHANEFLLKKLEMDREMKEHEFQLRREEAERKRQDDQRRFEREEREEERRRQDEERRRQDEERRRQDEMERARRLDIFQQQLLQQNQMLLELLKNQRKE